jgi:hypothetical protein
MGRSGMRFHLSKSREIFVEMFLSIADLLTRTERRRKARLRWYWLDCSFGLFY